MAIIQALISFFIAENDSLNSISAGDCNIVFQSFGPLYFVIVSETGENFNALRTQLSYINHQLLTLIPSLHLQRIFTTHVNYDLRNLLSGTEIYFDKLCDAFNVHHVNDFHAQGKQKITSVVETTANTVNPVQFIVSAICCLRMSARLRNDIGDVFKKSKPPKVIDTLLKGLLFGVLLSKDKLITLIRPHNHSLHPSDITVLTNTVNSSPNFKASESWTPMSLPSHAPTSSTYIYAYVCFFSRNHNVESALYSPPIIDGDQGRKNSFGGGHEMCLVLLCTSQEGFFDMKEYKGRIVEKLEQQNLVDDLEKSLISDPYKLAPVVEIGIHGLRHFVYKTKSKVQYTQPVREPPYTNDDDWRRLLRLYQHNQATLHSTTTPTPKQIFLVGVHESVFTWTSRSMGFTLHATFSPFTNHTTAKESVKLLRKWVVANENLLFLNSSA
ncbi:Vacuolar fusion protein mon1b, partial [Nowakowskiella sp. JEL0078]